MLNFSPKTNQQARYAYKCYTYKIKNKKHVVNYVIPFYLIAGNIYKIYMVLISCNRFPYVFLQNFEVQLLVRVIYAESALVHLNSYASELFADLCKKNLGN